MSGLEAVTAIAAVILILVLAWWWSRFLGRKMSASAVGRYMKVIDSVMIGRDRQLLLVRIKDETFLIGVSQQQVSFMTKVSGDFEDEAPDAGRTAPGMPFMDALDRVLGQMKDRKEQGKK